MTLYVNEFHGLPGLFRQPALKAPLASYSLSSAVAGPFPSANADYIGVSADAPMLVSVYSTSTTTALTSTNSIRVPANVATMFIACSTTNRVQAAST